MFPVKAQSCSTLNMLTLDRLRQHMQIASIVSCRKTPSWTETGSCRSDSAELRDDQVDTLQWARNCYNSAQWHHSNRGRTD